MKKIDKHWGMKLEDTKDKNIGVIVFHCKECKNIVAYSRNREKESK